MRVYVAIAVILTLSMSVVLTPRFSAAQLMQVKEEVPTLGWTTKIKAWLGNHYAQIQLGLAYATGIGVERDMITAREWWEKAAQADEPDAQYALGLLNSYNGFDGGQQDFKKAAIWFAHAAKHKLAWAQFSLGYLFATGKIGEPDLAAAREWYQKAADGGNEYAQLNLGLLLQQETDNPESLATAAKLYRNAAQQGNMAAAYLLGNMLERGLGVNVNLDLAATYYRRAAESGIPDAQTAYGDFFYDGKGGTPQKHEEALRWYLRAAEQGNATAATLVARMYDAGIGTEKNDRMAANWSSKSVKLGLTPKVDYHHDLETFEHFVQRYQYEEADKKMKDDLAAEEKRRLEKN